MTFSAYFPDDFHRSRHVLDFFEQNNVNMENLSLKLLDRLYNREFPYYEHMKGRLFRAISPEWLGSKIQNCKSFFSKVFEPRYMQEMTKNNSRGKKVGLRITWIYLKILRSRKPGIIILTFNVIMDTVRGINWAVDYPVLEATYSRVGNKVRFRIVFGNLCNKNAPEKPFWKLPIINSCILENLYGKVSKEVDSKIWHIIFMMIMKDKMLEIKFTRRWHFSRRNNTAPNAPNMIVINNIESDLESTDSEPVRGFAFFVW